jgi:hypothetical protein
VNGIEPMTSPPQRRDALSLRDPFLHIIKETWWR